MGKKVKVDITYSWEVSERDWTANKKFHESLEDNITWKAKDDPISVFHFLNCIDQPKDLRVSVERVDVE
tara:strand:+ start:524 stop:730 length:207 start_codon:yes stop_codon:yes gene_type:complete